MNGISLKHIYKIYPNGVPAVKDFTMDIKDQEFVVLVGSSGCGKSTLLRQLKPSVAPHGTLSGEIFFHNRSLQDMDPVSAASEIGFVMQSPETQIVTDKVMLESALASLDETDRDLLLRHAAGETYAELAADFGYKTAGGVQKRIERIRQKLKDFYEKGA